MSPGAICRLAKLSVTAAHSTSTAEPMRPRTCAGSDPPGPVTGGRRPAAPAGWMVVEFSIVTLSSSRPARAGYRLTQMS